MYKEKIKNKLIPLNIAAQLQEHDHIYRSQT